MLHFSPRRIADRTPVRTSLWQAASHPSAQPQQAPLRRTPLLCRTSGLTVEVGEMQKAGALTTRPGVSAASARSPCSTTGPTSARCWAARPPRWPASQTSTATRRTPYAASPAPRRRRAGLLHRRGRPAPVCRPRPAGAAGRARAGRSCAAAAGPLAREQRPARGCRERFRAAHAPRSERPCSPLARRAGARAPRASAWL